MRRQRLHDLIQITLREAVSMYSYRTHYAERYYVLVFAKLDLSDDVFHAHLIQVGFDVLVLSQVFFKCCDEEKVALELLVVDVMHVLRRRRQRVTDPVFYKS